MPYILFSIILRTMNSDARPVFLEFLPIRGKNENVELAKALLMYFIPCTA